jgi:hypothetical protein
MNGQRFRPLWAVSFASLLLICAQASAQPPQTAANAVNVVPALDGVFDAFASHPIVAIGDDHGLAQSLDFYAAVVRDPRFATDVGNLVVEFGGAAHQDVLDRYLAGETVPYTELRKVWTDVVSGPELYIGGKTESHLPGRAAHRLVQDQNPFGTTALSGPASVLSR